MPGHQRIPAPRTRPSTTLAGLAFMFAASKVKGWRAIRRAPDVRVVRLRPALPYSRGSDPSTRRRYCPV